MSNTLADENSDALIFMPLGSGQEVGRSCHYLQFKSKKIMFDCGIHPGMHGVDALPFVDFIDCEDLDLLLITHFHLDHCGALPWLLEKTAFRGRCFATHATKAIYRMLIGDFIKVAKYGGGSESRMLYTEEDLERSMDKIEVIDFHEQKEVNGIKFWCYVAGHVLGAAMFMVEIAGIRILYTGDFSRLEDRHLCAAELPNLSPDIMISESTYGTQIHESRDDREKRFTSIVHEIVGRGGRCLIPAFALGRAQELLLILDEYWEQHPELHDIPVYYASSLAKKCMAVYQTFVSGMNQHIQRQIAVNNPFVFKHISNLKSIDHFDDVGPCVVLASPGMLQKLLCCQIVTWLAFPIGKFLSEPINGGTSRFQLALPLIASATDLPISKVNYDLTAYNLKYGLSRELFENWCTDSKNGCVIAGYCVEGTLAKHILSEPEEIISLSGQRLPMRLQVAYISFSAHTDYIQTSQFIRQLKPPNLILVHGEMNEMQRLRAAILRQYEDDNNFKIEVYSPRNTEAVTLYFRGQKTAKVVGTLAMNPPTDNDIMSGILIRRNFNYQLLHPNDLSSYTELSNSKLTQCQSIFYDGTFPVLLHNLRQLADVSVEEPPTTKDPQHMAEHYLKMFKGQITISVHPSRKVIIIDWASNPVNDMYADAVLSAILHAQTNPILEKYIPKYVDSTDRLAKTEEALVSTLRELCGPDVVTKNDGDIVVNVDSKTARINPQSLNVSCTDPLLQHLFSSVSNKIAHSTLPT